MSKPPGLSHGLSDNESENDKQLRSMGIIATAQLGLGSEIRLNVKGNEWVGFVVSIDRFGVDHKFVVCWSFKPTNANPNENYGIFRMSQASNVHGDSWEIDVSTVPSY